MRAIMVMFDSLNRHMLPVYGAKNDNLPNFARLASRSVTFDTCYAGSMPCMPARRECFPLLSNPTTRQYVGHKTIIEIAGMQSRVGVGDLSELETAIAKIAGNE